MDMDLRCECNYLSVYWFKLKHVSKIPGDERNHWLCMINRCFSSTKKVSNTFAISMIAKINSLWQGLKTYGPKTPWWVSLWHNCLCKWNECLSMCALLPITPLYPESLLPHLDLEYHGNMHTSWFPLFVFVLISFLSTEQYKSSDVNFVINVGNTGSCPIFFNVV